MKFNLTNEIDVIRFRTKVEYHINKKTRNVELTEKRTLKQNNYLHLLLAWFAIESGNTMEYVKLNYYKKLANPDLFITEKNDKYLGRVQVIRSSSDLSTSEMTASIDRFRNWSSMEAGIYLPAANEDNILSYIQEEIEKYKMWI
ncbi:MAG: hypothetical protein FWF52_00450 [Candidatus Azobacteroides sp.]|nr:hypothetical protein [Candidatus Azobacteroides sp.]